MAIWSAVALAAASSPIAEKLRAIWFNRTHGDAARRTWDGSSCISRVQRIRSGLESHSRLCASLCCGIDAFGLPHDIVRLHDRSLSGRDSHNRAGNWRNSRTPRRRRWILCGSSCHFSDGVGRLLRLAGSNGASLIHRIRICGVYASEPAAVQTDPEHRQASWQKLTPTRRQAVAASNLSAVHAQSIHRSDPRSCLSGITKCLWQ